MKDKDPTKHPPHPSPPPAGAALSAEAARIVSVVREDPGSNIGRTRDRSGLGRCVFDNALAEATQAGVVHQVPNGRDTLLFPDHKDLHQVAPQLIALKDADTSQLYWLLYDQLEITNRQEALQCAVQEFGWNTHHTRWMLHQLEEANLLKAFHGWQDRRQVKYRCLPIHPFVLQVLEKTETS